MPIGGPHTPAQNRPAFFPRLQVSSAQTRWIWGGGGFGVLSAASGLRLGLQNRVFALLSQLIELNVQQARKAGTLALGCLHLGGGDDGRKCAVAASAVLRPGPREARHVTVELDRGMPFARAEAVLAEARRAGGGGGGGDEYDGFYMSRYGKGPLLAKVRHAACAA